MSGKESNTVAGEVVVMKRGFVYAGMAAVALMLFAGPVLANWAHPQLLVSADELEKNLTKPDWVIVDCRKLEEYAKGHIPGAISFGKNCKDALRDATSRVFPTPAKYEGLVGKAGIGNNTQVVFYGEMKSKSLDDASVAFWVFEYLGHTDKAHVLNGGLEAWTKAGKKLDAQPTIKPATTFKVNFAKNRRPRRSSRSPRAR
jgi:thiosulfate/3-mercaptopyruvate sulfurtransferase